MLNAIHLQTKKMCSDRFIYASLMLKLNDVAAVLTDVVFIYSHVRPNSSDWGGQSNSYRPMEALE